MTQSSHVEVSDSAEERLSEVFLKTQARSADLDAITINSTELEMAVRIYGRAAIL